MSGFISTTTMIILGAALLGLAAAGTAPTNLKVHELMTVEEIRQVFQAEPHTVPEYEVRQIRCSKLHKRAANIGTAQKTPTHMQLKAFGRDISLWLQPLDGLLAGIDTPVYHARADEKGIDGVRFEKIVDPLSLVGRVLEDKDRMATLLVKLSANGKQLISGNVGSEMWNIRPLPMRFGYRNLGRHQRSVDDYDNVENVTIVEYDATHPHVIYKTPAAAEGTKYASLPFDADLLRSQPTRSKRAPVTIPSKMYPQLLVVADYATYQRHKEDTHILLEYLVTFWNGVDLRYRSFEKPKIRLNIAGIIIETDPNVLYYLWQSRLTTEKIDVSAALESSGIYRRKIEYVFPSNSSDIMVTMSPYDMCNPKEAGCPIGIIGLAYVGGACQYSDYPVRKSLSVAVIQDKGGFEGIHTAAHELGHLFGATHDGKIGVPCSSNSGYIMSPSPLVTENFANWSQCSLEAFNQFFKKQVPVCLFNEPRSRSDMPRVLPGRLRTMNEQCLAIKGTETCFRDPRYPPKNITQYEDESCLKLKCLDATGYYCEHVGHIPVDGSVCDQGKICLYGKCLRQADVI